MTTDTFLFIFFAIFALILRWLTKKAEGTSQTPSAAPNEQPNKPIPRASARSDEESIRGFLEALGAPPGSAPPPQARPRSTVPRRLSAPSAPPPAPARRQRRSRRWEQPLPPLVSAPPPLAEPAPPPLVITPAAPEPSPPQIMSRPVLRAPPPLAVALPPSLGNNLRNRSAVRRALVLREILGPPRALEI